MVTERLAVWLHGTRVAEIARSDGRLRLTYDTRHGSVSTSMNALVAEHPHGRVTAWLDGLLPDNEQVVQRWAREMQVTPTAFSLLATPIGLDCAGAVQFTPGDQELPTDRDSGIEWLDAGGLARLGDSLYGDRTAWGEPQRSGRFSLAGAQTKVALRKDGDRFGLPYGNEPTNVIVKPSLPGFAGHAVNEHLCMEAARGCGLMAAPSRVESFGEHRVFVVRRFDRVERGGQLGRIHTEDLCQALGVHPGVKYQSDGGPTPKQIAERLREVVAPIDAPGDIRRFFEALIFNWLVVGTDAHAKNYGLLLPHEGTPRLAPLYDVASMAPYEDPLGCKLAMKLGGEFRFKAIAPIQHIARAARELGVSDEWGVERARALVGQLPDAIATAAIESGLEADPMAVQLRDTVASHIRARLPA